MKILKKYKILLIVSCIELKKKKFEEDKNIKCCQQNLEDTTTKMIWICSRNEREGETLTKTIWEVKVDENGVKANQDIHGI